MSGKVYLYPIWIRLWHILNALLCLALIITGISMHYASPEGTRISFGLSVTMHNICGVVLTFNYLIFFLGNLFTGNGLNYIIQFRNFRQRMWKQIRYYAFGVFLKEQAPYPIGSARKFNPLQQVTYAMMMYFIVPIIFITGWALLFPNVIAEKWLGVDTFALTDFLHIAGGFGVSVFLIIHLYFATMGHKPTDHYKAMWSGYHDDETEHESKDHQ